VKIIKYKYLSCEVNHGTEENPDIEQILSDKEMHCPTQAVFDTSYPIAESEAVGEIIVEGEFEIDEPTWQDRIEAQVTYNSMMLGTLIEEE
jgi:hypothetical protein